MLLRFLAWLGRKDVLVDVFGDVHWHRYYLLYRERTDAPRWRDWLPNAYIHIFPTTEPDGEDAHSHPWASVGIVLRGWYMEDVNDGCRTTRRWGLAPLRHTDRHRLSYVEPGTMTLFMHWFRRAPWRFFIRKHEVICDHCKAHNAGVCHKTDAVLDFGQFLSRMEHDASVGFTKSRSMRWAQDTPALQVQLRRRREAVRRMRVTVPPDKAGKYELAKVRLSLAQRAH